MSELVAAAADGVLAAGAVSFLAVVALSSLLQPTTKRVALNASRIWYFINRCAAVSRGAQLAVSMMPHPGSSPPARSGVIKSVGHSVLSGRKAAEGCRTPKPSVLEARARVALAFWTAAALCRFFRLPAKTATSNRTLKLTRFDWRRVELSCYSRHLAPDDEPALECCRCPAPASLALRPAELPMLWWWRFHPRVRSASG